MKNQDTLQQIAEDYHLDNSEINDFIMFYQRRFPEKMNVSPEYFDRYYAEIWARRFSKFQEYHYSDSKSQRVLKKINPKKYKKVFYLGEKVIHTDKYTGGTVYVTDFDRNNVWVGLDSLDPNPVKRRYEDLKKIKPIKNA